MALTESDSFFISVLDDETIKLVSKPNAKLMYKEYDTLKAIYKKLLPNQEKYKMLIVFQEGFSLEKNPLDFLKNKIDLSYRKAEAYVIISPIFRVFVSVGIKMRTLDYPIKICKTEEEAELWLKEQ